MTSSLSHNHPHGKVSKVVLFILAGIGGMSLLGCLSCGGLVWFGWGAAIEAIASEVRTRYGDSPAIQENIGEIEHFNVNFEKTQQVREEYGNNDMMLFDISGPKGSGELIIERHPGSEGFEGVILKTDKGEFDLE